MSPEPQTYRAWLATWYDPERLWDWYEQNKDKISRQTALELTARIMILKVFPEHFADKDAKIEEQIAFMDALMIPMSHRTKAQQKLCERRREQILERAHL